MFEKAILSSKLPLSALEILVAKSLMFSIFASPVLVMVCNIAFLVKAFDIFDESEVFIPSNKPFTVAFIKLSSEF